MLPQRPRPQRGGGACSRAGALAFYALPHRRRRKLMVCTVHMDAPLVRERGTTKPAWTPALEKE
jgi:hypothetical protein